MAASSDQDGVLCPEGPLTLATVTARYREFEPLWSGAQPPGAVDLARTERIDSSGLALLLEWQAQARRNGKTLSFRNPPAGLLRLAALCEASEALGLDAQPEEQA